MSTTMARPPLTTTTDRSRRGRRGRRILALLPLGMAIMVAVDSVLGDAAEYFNATRLLAAWGDVARGRGPGEHTFIVGQEHMGDALSLATGSALFVVEPAIVICAFVYGAAAVGSIRRRRFG